MIATGRHPALITFSTWKALFLRTAVARLSTSRFAWFWIIADPLSSIVILMLAFTFLRVRHIGGINTAVWIMAGVLSFVTFRRTATEAMNAVRRSQGLYAYPQIRPFDPPVAHALLEGLITIMMGIVLLTGATLVGFDVIPADPLRVIWSLFGMWLFGLGYGLINSVAMVVAPPVSSVMSYILRPLYFVSGVMIPVTLFSYPYRGYFLLNPLVHGLESAREGFAPRYHVPPEVDIWYLYAWAVGLLCLGLALHVRYRDRLMGKK